LGRIIGKTKNGYFFLASHPVTSLKQSAYETMKAAKGSSTKGVKVLF